MDCIILKDASLFMRTLKEDERKRREKEERIAREEEFLRSSLRGSRKLQALEETSTKVLPPSTGVVNIAYTGRDEDEEEDDDEQAAKDQGFTSTAGLASWASAVAQQNNYLLNGGMQKIIGNYRSRTYSVWIFLIDDFSLVL